MATSAAKPMPDGSSPERGPMIRIYVFEMQPWEEPWFHDEGWNWSMWHVFVWLFPLVCLVGAVANACSFYVIASRRKSFPYVTRQYLLIITMNDFFTLTFKAGVNYFGYMALYVKHSNWSWFTHPRSWGFGWCVAYDLFTYYLIVGAHFFQLGLTVDRLVAVAAPMRAKLILTHRRSWAMLAVIVVMALLVPVMVASNRRWDSAGGYCGTRSSQFHTNVYRWAELFYGRVFLISLLMLGTVAVSVLLAWSYRAAQRMQADAGLAGTQHQRISRERRRSLVRFSLIMICTNFIFMATSLPWSIASMYETHAATINMGDASFRRMRTCFDTLQYLSNAVSWPVYFIGSNFRKAFRQTFLSWTCRCRTGGSGGIPAVELPLRPATRPS